MKYFEEPVTYVPPPTFLSRAHAHDNDSLSSEAAEMIIRVLIDAFPADDTKQLLTYHKKHGNTLENPINLVFKSV